MNGKKKMSTEELCAQPADPEVYEDSWEKQLPNFAKDCNYCPEAQRTRQSREIDKRYR